MGKTAGGAFDGGEELRAFCQGLGMSIHIGTLGWHYTRWSGVFYPSDLKKGDWLAYYAQHFDCVEINSSYYRLPKAARSKWQAGDPGAHVPATHWVGRGHPRCACDPIGYRRGSLSSRRDIHPLHVYRADHLLRAGIRYGGTGTGAGAEECLRDQRLHQ